MMMGGRKRPRAIRPGRICRSGLLRLDLFPISDVGGVEAAWEALAYHQEALFSATERGSKHS